ncbi:hypothetical protein TNCV_3029121 [Trichonephila clavipes]|nr:hypothetical protein TNCV_3029121 [Trichonephila clavipes]
MANPKNRNSTRKSKFKGNRYTIKNNQYEINKNVRSAPTASERKTSKGFKKCQILLKMKIGTIIGKGHSAARKLCSAINVKSPSKTAFKYLEKKKLKHVSNNVAYKTMNEAAAEIHEKNNFDEVQCGVSVDGTWQRRVTFVFKWMC